MSLQLFGHPFSSYTWKVLIALWADETPFKFRMLGPDHPENGDELRRRSPFGQFPLLVDGDRSVAEATCIIEHLQAYHPGPNRWIPDGELGRRVRFLDRVFDLRVMANMQAVVFDAVRRASIETLPTAASRVNGSAQHTTGSRRIWTGALGRLASSSRWLIVRRHHRCSTPIGSRRSTEAIHS